MTNRKLDHYYYKESEGRVVHIYGARQYDSRGLKGLTGYRYKENKRAVGIHIYKNRSLHMIYSDDKRFFSTYKRMSKLKALLLW